MSQWPPSPRLPRTLLWLTILVMMALFTLSKPASWAATVMAPRNQTVPPAKTSTYLPTVHRSGAHSLINALEENGTFSTLLQALEAANFTAALETASPFTLFAPTDAVFAQLPEGALDQLLANPTGQLTQILLFHIVPGEYKLDDLEHGMEITTLQGSSIGVDRSVDSLVIINGARIITPNLEASNGVIHAINTVLLPPPPSDRSEVSPVNVGSCGGDDGCKFKLTGGPSFANNGGREMKLQLFLMHSGIDGGQPQGDYHLAVERGGQLISTFADATSMALTKNQGSMGPYNYEGKLGAKYLPGGRLDGLYYFWVLDGNRERDSDVFQMVVPPGQGEIWIQFDQR